MPYLDSAGNYLDDAQAAELRAALDTKRWGTAVKVYDLYVPELRQPFRSILPCPGIIFVAWHRQAQGIHELLDINGHDKYRSPPQDDLWERRAYQRADGGPDVGFAHYELLRP